MANKFNHARKIEGIQPAKFTAITPGMIITFNYSSSNKNINDKKTNHDESTWRRNFISGWKNFRF